MGSRKMVNLDLYEKEAYAMEKKTSDLEKEQLKHDTQEADRRYENDWLVQSYTKVDNGVLTREELHRAIEEAKKHPRKIQGIVEI